VQVRPDELHTQTCRVLTHGRRTGAEHVVTVWFVIIERRFYAASRHGLRGDWLQNALEAGSLEVRSAKGSWQGAATLAAPEEIPQVLDAFAAKYRQHPSIIAAWRQDPPVFVRADLG
jgi:hypothetical protein